MLSIESLSWTSWVVRRGSVPGLPFTYRLFFLPKSILRVSPATLLYTLPCLTTVNLSDVLCLKPPILSDQPIYNTFVVIFIVFTFLFAILPLKLTLCLTFVPIFTIDTGIAKFKMFVSTFIRDQRFPFPTSTWLSSNRVDRMDIDMHLFDLRHRFSLLHFRVSVRDAFQLDFLN